MSFSTAKFHKFVSCLNNVGSQSRDFEKYERYQIRVFRDAWRVIPIFEAFKTENSKAFSEHTKNLFPLPSQKVGVFFPVFFTLKAFYRDPMAPWLKGLKPPGPGHTTAQEISPSKTTEMSWQSLKPKFRWFGQEGGSWNQENMGTPVFWCLFGGVFCIKYIHFGGVLWVGNCLHFIHMDLF